MYINDLAKYNYKIDFSLPLNEDNIPLIDERTIKMR